VCRYLVCGSDSASLYLEVLSVDDQDITCEAKNGAVMDGLMTVRGHAEDASINP
jgi:pyruvate kinase